MAEDTGAAPPLLTVGQAAQVLQVTKQTTYRLVQAGTVPSIDLGGIIRVPTDKLAERMDIPMDAIGRFLEVIE